MRSRLALILSAARAAVLSAAATLAAIVGKISLSRIPPAVVISIAAFGLSATTFYFNFFRVSESLELTVLNAQYSNGTSEPSTDERITFDCVLVNKGNREAALVAVYVTVYRPNGVTWPVPQEFVEGVQRSVRAEFVPVVVKPNEIKVFAFTQRVPSDVIHETAVEAYISGSDRGYEAFLGAGFRALNHDGEFVSNIRFVARMVITKKRDRMDLRMYSRNALQLLTSRVERHPDEVLAGLK